MTSAPEVSAAAQQHWLKRYYAVRATFSAAWVAATVTVGQREPAIGALLLIVYPLWDAAANYLDAARSGGLRRNRSQTVNVAVSLATTLAVVLALQVGTAWVLGVFGVWAILAGMLQLGAALRRWRQAGAQWAMVLSGGQSALAGVLFIVRATAQAAPTTVDIAGYASVGAFYFLISAVWLTVSGLRHRPARA